MEKIGIVTEEATDFPKDIIQKNQIAIVPLKLFWPELDQMPGENTFQKMRELEKKGIQSFGKTSQPSIKDFLDKYNLQLERFEKILCITVTSKLSGSYNSALQAKKFLKLDQQDKVFVIDSLSVTGGQALLILKAIDLIQKGKEINEIVKELEEFVPQTHLYVMLEDPKWVEAAGRISSLVANLMRGMAKIGIRPVLTLKNGVLVPAGIKTRAKDVSMGLLKQFEADIKKFKMEDRKIKLIITHGDNFEGAQKLKEMIEKEFKNTKVVFLNIIDDILGALAGPNSLVLAWAEI